MSSPNKPEIKIPGGFIKRPRTIAPLNGPVDYIAAAIATCGVGFVRVASGTFGSMLATMVWFWASTATPQTKFMMIGIASVVGVWAAGRSERFWGHDPSQTVIDEVAGQWIALLPVTTPSPILGAIAFFLFRLFDVIKPPPIRQSQNLPGGWGVMVDDILAGIAAMLIVMLIKYFFPGLEMIGQGIGHAG